METKEATTEHREAGLQSVSSAARVNERRTSIIDDIFWKLDAAVPDLAQLTSNAIAATHSEHAMTVREGLRLYPKAIAWSMLLSLAIIMEGYDTILINQFFALPGFKKHYGKLNSNGDYELSTAWQSGLTNGQVIGSIIGLLLNGIIAERYGYRICMMCSLVAVACFVSLAFFAVNVQMLEVAEVLCGIPWGVFQTVTTTYAAEVMPVALRAYLTTYINLCWITGQLIGSGILRGFVNNTTQWSYRIPFALQWVWIIPLLTGVYFAPESPWWLTRHNRLEETKLSLLRLTSNSDVHFNVDETVAMMRHTHELEKAMHLGESYLDCFKRGRAPPHRNCLHVLRDPNPLRFPTIYLLHLLLLPGRHSFATSLRYVYWPIRSGICSHLLHLGLIRICSRRTIYLGGLGLMFALLLVIGGLGTST